MRIKKLICILMTSVLCLTTVGCGTDKNTQTNEPNSETENVLESEALGRYVEKEIKVLDEFTSVSKLFKLEDGNYEFYTDRGIYMSADKGETWTLSSPDWFANNRGYYIDVEVGPGNLTAFTYNPEEQEEYLPISKIVYPDGSEVNIKFDGGSEHQYFNDFAFNTDGRLFGKALGFDTIYEIDTKTGEVSSYLDIAGVREPLAIKDDYMTFIEKGEMKLYDLKNDCYVEDDTITSFVKNTFGRVDFLQDGCYNVVPFYGNDQDTQTIYVAGEKGLYRHIIGGEMVEKVVDERLCVLSDTKKLISSVIEVEEDDNSISFIMAETCGKLYKLSYDGNAESTPNKKITVFSMFDNDTIKTAIKNYMTNNPDTYVDYQYGMNSDNKTVEDVIKELNTKLLSDDGPDVLVLDYMPIKQYEEKGILLDISKEISEINEVSPLFMNLITPFYRNDRVYVVPAECSVPIVFGDKNIGSDRIKNLEQLVDIVENVRKVNPDSDIFGISSASGVMAALLPICEPSWTSENGRLNSEDIQEYLLAAKKLYDLQLDGTPSNRINEYVDFSRGYETEFHLSNRQELKSKTVTSFYDYWSGKVKMGFGSISSISGLCSFNSLKNNENFKDSRVVGIEGQSSSVYWPETMVGICAKTQDRGTEQEAKQFLKEIFSVETQKQIDYPLPVNKAALDALYEMARNGENSYSICASDATGKMISMDVDKPEQKDMDFLTELLSSAQTPYINNDLLESVLYDEGIGYLLGHQDIDTAVNNIVEKTAIYLGE